MKNRLILFIYIIINLCTISVVKAGDYHLLPQPQKFTPSHLNFQVNKVQLSTPVLQQEWETLISEMGGTVSPKATGTIEVKLLPTLPEIPMNQDEAYRLSITKKRIIVEAVTERGVYWAMQTLRQLAEKGIQKRIFKELRSSTGLLSGFADLCRMLEEATFHWMNLSVKSPRLPNSKSMFSLAFDRESILASGK